MDIVMPGMNGYQATRGLAERSRNARHSDCHGDSRDMKPIVPGDCARERSTHSGQAGVARPTGQGTGDARRLTCRRVSAQEPARSAVRTPSRARAPWTRGHRQRGRRCRESRRVGGCGAAHGRELYLVAREEAREVLGVPAPASPRVPVPRAGSWGSPTCAASCCRSSTCARTWQRPDAGLVAHTRVIVVEVIATYPPACWWTRCSGSGASPKRNSPPTCRRPSCVANVTSPARSGAVHEQWPVLGLRALVEDPAFSEASS